MKNTHQALVLKGGSEKDLSKLQTQFNKLVQKINELKVEIKDTETQIQTAQIRLHAEIIPLEKRVVEVLAGFVKLFDRHYEHANLKKRDKKTLSENIYEKAYQLIDGHGLDELKPIFEKHNEGRSFEEEDAEANEATASMMKEMMSQMMGVEFDEDIDVSSPEKMQEYLAQKMEEQQAAKEAKRASRKKTPAQLAKEEKRKAEEQQLSKTSRAIYTDLVKTFHPDREQDPAEKERKTKIMHQITEAYEKDDLFELLRLRLEHLNTDLQATTDEQLKYYVKLLKEQVKELEEQLGGLQWGGPQFDNGFMSESFYDRFCGDAYVMDIKFKREAKRLKKQIKDCEKELVMLEDPEILKSYLEDYRQMQKQAKKNPMSFLFG